MIRKLVVMAVAIVALAACASDITGVNLPVVGNVAGAWSGDARWDAVQGGAADEVTSGAANAVVQQNGSAVSGTWQVTNRFAATFGGAIDNDGNLTGPTTVVVDDCDATAFYGGSLSADGSILRISVSFNEGVVPCPGAPIGLELTLVR